MVDKYDVSDAKYFWECLRPGVYVDHSGRFRFISSRHDSSSGGYGIMEDRRGGMKVVDGKTEAFLIAEKLKQKGAVL